MLLFGFLITFIHSSRDKMNDEYQPSFWNFITTKNKQFTLTQIKDHNEYRMLPSDFRHRCPSQTNIEDKQWYYVHIEPKYMNEIKQYIQIDSRSYILKNTFSLFLSHDQINQIKDKSFIKAIEPKNKFDEDGGLLSQTNYLFVRIHPEFELIQNSDMYVIETKKGRDSYIIRIDKNGMNEKQFQNKKEEVVEFLSSIHYVKTVSTFQKPIPLNHLYTGFIQKHNQTVLPNPEITMGYMEKYMNKRGITGEGQIITVLDTFLDAEHPMFYDPTVPIEINTTMPNHRKILYYSAPSNCTNWKSCIAENEHGTHVSGTAAGKSLPIDGKETASNLFDGNAPDAKIVYAGQLDYINFTEVEYLMNKHNSRISTNSWGNLEYHNDENNEMGQIAERNPQSLIIFAAGNSEEFSVFDPNGCKNIVSVGAIDHSYTGLSYTVENLDNPSNVFKCFNFCATDYWVEGTIGYTPEEASIVAVNVSLGKCDYANGKHYTLLLGETEDMIISFFDDCHFNETYGMFSITEDFDIIHKIIENKERVKLTNNFTVSKKLGIRRTYFSSTGPGNKGILKPDVYGPGSVIFSAKATNKTITSQRCEDIANGNCGLVFMSGTSMAAPNIAGAAALIGHYFNSGKWIDKIDLDGTTLRALLINSCKHPLNAKMPDVFWGHGAVDLSTIIPIDGDFGVQITPQWRKPELTSNIKEDMKKPSVDENGHVAAKIDVKSNKVDLQITLSYLDVELGAESPIPLNHDLDLIVVSPEGTIYKGDHLAHNDTQHTSTNEKIIIAKEEIQAGTYTLHVYGNSFADSYSINKQEFAVVASGDIDNQYLLFTNSTESPCKDEDPNHKGMCRCNENEIGPICQSVITTVKGTQYEVELDPLQVMRVKFIADKKIFGVRSSSNNPGRWSTIWASKECHLNLGDYEINGQTGKQTGKLTSIDFGSNEICVAIFNINDKTTNYSIELEFNNPTKNKTIIIVVVVIVCVIIIIAIALLVYFFACKKKYAKMASESTNMQLI